VTYVRQYGLNIPGICFKKRDFYAAVFVRHESLFFCQRQRIINRFETCGNVQVKAVLAIIYINFTCGCQNESAGYFQNDMHREDER